MSLYLNDSDVRLYHGDALEQLAAMPSESVQCIVTSPPFWGLRDYGEAGQIGIEETPEAWCDALVAVFREARRVLRGDGVMWLEVGDSYATKPNNNAYHGIGPNTSGLTNPDYQDRSRNLGENGPPEGCKPKDLVGAPWMLAFALRADGWYLRSDTIWARPNPMPESVTDRPTKAHSYVFLLTKSARYFYDADAIREESEWRDYNLRHANAPMQHANGDRKDGGAGNHAAPAAGRNARSVWSIPTEPTPFAHFATFPQALVERCIKSGSAEGDVILDPFVGSGTTCLVARRLGRRAVGIELNGEYLGIAAKRLEQLSLLA